MIMRSPHSRSSGFAPEREHVLHDAAVGAVDQLVELDQRSAPVEVALRERVERDPDHLLGPRAHLLERLHAASLGRDPAAPASSSLAIVTQ